MTKNSSPKWWPTHSQIASLISVIVGVALASDQFISKWELFVDPIPKHEKGLIMMACFVITFLSRAGIPALSGAFGQQKNVVDPYWTNHNGELAAGSNYTSHGGWSDPDQAQAAIDKAVALRVFPRAPGVNNNQTAGADPPANSDQETTKP